MIYIFILFLFQRRILRCGGTLQSRAAREAMSQCGSLAVRAAQGGPRSLVSSTVSSRVLCYLLPIKQIKVLLCH